MGNPQKIPFTRPESGNENLRWPAVFRPKMQRFPGSPGYSVDSRVDFFERKPQYEAGMPFSSQNEGHLEIDNDKLMEEIQKYPEIYDKSVKEYGDTRMKQAAWLKIEKDLNIRSGSAFKRYNTIRTKFAKHMKSIRIKYGRAASEDMINPKLDNLRWLLPYIAHRSDHGIRRSSEHDDKAKTKRRSGVDGAELSSATDGEDSHQTQVSASAKSTITSKLKYGRLNDRKKRNRTEDCALPNRTNETNAAAEDEHTLFCMSLVPKLRRLPPHASQLAQIKILQVIQEAAYPSHSLTATSQPSGSQLPTISLISTDLS